MTEDPFRNKEHGAITVELAKPEEWEAYKNIRLEALRENPEAFGVKLEDEVVRSDKEWEAKLLDPFRITVLLKSGTEAVGLAGAGKINGGKEGDRWRVVSVYIRSSFRGGQGEKLVSAVLGEIKKRGGDHVTLNVSKGPKQAPALALYKKLGFREKNITFRTLQDSSEMELYLK